MKSRLRPAFRRRQRAFTLIELLVVIGIIAIVAAITLPVLRRVNESARAVVCQGHLRTLMNGFLLYAADYNRQLPGNEFDRAADQAGDWLAGHVDLGTDTFEKLARVPKAGTLWPYVRNAAAYRCPALDAMAGRGAESNGRFDYSAFKCLSGARVAAVSAMARFNFNHTTPELAYPTPVIVEEYPERINGTNVDGGHSNHDQFGVHHRGGSYYASINGGVFWFKYPPQALNEQGVPIGGPKTDRDGPYADAWDWELRSPSGAWRTMGEFRATYGYWNRRDSQTP
jgi:prepilin-type N-terminal cleavage/methylation domain-containing protein